MKKLLGIVVLGLLLNGCATVTPTGGLYKDTTLESGKSRIIIFRKGGSLIGMDTPEVIIVGKTSLSFYLPSKTFIQEDLKPGSYKVVVQKDSKNSGTVWRFKPIGQEVITKENETVYLELKTFSTGYTHHTKLIFEGEDYAIKKMKKMQRVLSSDNAEF